MKTFGMLLALACTAFSQPLWAGNVSGDLRLRDAIYLYNLTLTANGSRAIGATDCDVFQLVLDVNGGYTDIFMGEGDNSTELNASTFTYPDRIYDSAAMFAYALTQIKTYKYFSFFDANYPTATGAIADATVFGYCYSTRTTARVYLIDLNNCVYRYSNGSTEPVPNCTP